MKRYSALRFLVAFQLTTCVVWSFVTLSPISFHVSLNGRTLKSKLHAFANHNDGNDRNSSISEPVTIQSRRKIIQKTALIGGALTTGSVTTNNAYATEDLINETTSATKTFSASWTAVDGLNSLDSQSQFVSFDASAYKAMRDDPTRTPQFQKAIEQRLGDNPEEMVVVDLGTGPFALFAIIAAQLGAGKVYAIEASPDIAQSARATIKKAGFDDIITVIEDFSTNVILEQKADFVIAEIVGSVASEEGAYATIKSAHSKLLKDPNNDRSWIPSRIQTYAAPASYTLHNLFGPPEFDWSKLNDPVRFNCRDKGLELLSDPVLVEDISFSQIMTKQQDERNKQKSITFTVDAERMEENQKALYQEFRRGNSSAKDSEVMARKTAHSMSGIALWPRIILNDDIIIDSRAYGDGAHQRSHWQTVLPIANDRPIENLKGGEMIVASVEFELPEDIFKSPKYSIKGSVNY